MHFSNVLLLYWQDGLEEQFIELLHLGIGQALSRRPLDLDYLQFVCNNALILFQSCADQVEIDNYIVKQLNYILKKIQAVFDKNVTVAHVDTAVGPKGRPRLLIQREQLHHLLECQITVPYISQLLGLSIRMVFHRMEEYGLSVTGYYSTMSDSELDNLVRAIKTQMPNGKGFRIQSIV